MLLNIIDGSDGTDHFDEIIPIQVIETCRQIIPTSLAFRKGCETLRFYVSQRKTSGLESAAQVVLKKSGPECLTKLRGALTKELTV